MAIKKYKPLSPDPYVGKIKGDTEFARLAHLNDLVDQVNSVPSGPTYKTFVAKISQTGTSNPVVTVLENTLGLSLTFTRANIGRYFSNTIPGDSSKITVTCSPGSGPTSYTVFAEAAGAGPGNIYIQLSSLANYPGAFIVDTGYNDALLTNAVLEIRVYP